MVCAVLKVPLQLLSTKPENPSVQYFTLEKGVNVLSGEDRTVLCAWDGETHTNYGDGPEASPGAFMECVARVSEA